MSSLLEKASLVMIPSGYKEDVVYSEIPIDGSADLVFTRASDGTRVNSAGLVENVPWNLLQYSEDFSNGVWVKTNTTVSTNTETAPNGTTTADSLLETTANATHQLWERPEMVAGQTFTQSCYIKTNGRNRVQLQIFDSSAIYASALFDVVSGTIIATNGTSSIESVGNGWYRCILSGVCPTSTTGYCVLNLATDSYTESTAQDSYTGDASKGVYIWGFQFNIGTTAKPYFPTTDRQNVPRLTYEGGCPSLLLEPQRTNTLTYSEQFDNADWAFKDKVTITSNVTATLDPSGYYGADKLVEDSSNNQHRIYRSQAGANGTFSFFAKAAERSWVSVLSNNGAFSFFNIGDGTLGTIQSGSTGKITPYANGWYRCELYNMHISYGALIQLATGNNVTAYQGDGTSGAYIWGAQFEASATYATSYIPTTSAAVTRVADSASKTGISSLIGGTSGTVFFDITTNPSLSSASYKQFCYYFDSASAQSYLYLNSVNQISTNVNWGSLLYSTPLQPNTRYKVALVYAPNDFALYINGVSVATASSGTPKNNERISIGQLTGTEMCEFVFNQYTHFPSRLTNTELAALTTL